MLEISSSAPSRLEAIADRLLSLSLGHGATAAQVSLHESQGLTVQLNNGRVASRTCDVRTSFRLKLYDGATSGQVTSTSFTLPNLEESVQAAIAIARHTQPDSAAGLAEHQWLCRIPRSLDLSHPWNLDLNTAVCYARQLEAGVAQAGARVHSDFARVSSSQSRSLLANTQGFSHATMRSNHSVTVSALARSGELAEKEFGWDASCDSRTLVGPEIIGRQAADLALRYLDRRPLSTCRCRVLFSPRCAASLCGHLIDAISDRPLYLGASFLKDRLGKEVMASHLILREDPFIEGGYASFAFDSDGIEPSTRDLIRSGVLHGYQLSLYGARRLGLQPTGNGSGTGNLILASTRTDTEDDLVRMLAQLDTGLFVTSLAGDGVQLHSGDYSRIARGFWVEQGQIQYAVTGVGIVGNLASMFQGIEAVGNDVARLGACTTGSVLIDSMQIAGQ